MSQLIRDITDITRRGRYYRAQILAPLGLKVCQAGYLTEICAQPGISQEALARILCINKSNVARQVAALEKEDYVNRIPSWEDKRVMKLYPTEKALALLPRLLDATQAWEQAITADLSPEEKQTLYSLMDRVKTSAAAQTEEAQE